MFDLSMVLMNQITTIHSTLHRFHGKIAEKNEEKIFFAHFLSICKPQFDFVIMRMQKLVKAHTVKLYEKKALESCTFDESQSNKYHFENSFPFRMKQKKNSEIFEQFFFNCLLKKVLKP